MSGGPRTFPFGIAHLKDPFSAACVRAEMPPGLLGRFDPPVWDRLAAHFEKTPTEWDPRDWENAARILGLMIDEIEESERFRKIADSILKRPGPKPKLPKEWQGLGLLDFPQPKKRGRPARWTPERLELLWGIAERIRRDLLAEGRRGTDAAVLERMIETGYALAKRSTPRLAKHAFRRDHEGFWRNALNRVKKRFSKLG